MLTLQATSQQACLPALTQGNMKITETITHIRIPPSAVEGQTLNISDSSWLHFSLAHVFPYMDNMGKENFYQIKSYVILKNLSLQCRISPVRGLIAPISGSVIKYKTFFHWKPQKWKQCSIIKEVFKSTEVDKNFFFFSRICLSNLTSVYPLTPELL